MKQTFEPISRIKGNSKESLLIISLLVLLSLGIYYQVTAFEFIDFDDSLYVFDNPQVKSGLHRKSIVWSFSLSDKEDTYYHPLTWLSHMLDVELFGLDAGAHHAVNLLIHSINAIILFLLLRRMTAATWLSGVVAILFVAHPVNVESVAWVAERKNVLSTLFWLLTIWMYIRYVEKPTGAAYGAMVIVFFLGLLAKPMLVTLPFVFLLLDIWPLRRLATAEQHSDGSTSTWFVLKRSLVLMGWRLLAEKLPLMIASFSFVYWVASSMARPGSMVGYDVVPIWLRLQNFLDSYVSYLYTIIWPFDLQFFYAYPSSISMWKTAVVFVLLIAVTALTLKVIRSSPFWFVGWAWFLGTLVPVSGIYQVGLWPSHADRWLYVPSIGIFIALSWGLKNVAVRMKALRWILIFVVCAGGVGMCWQSHRQAAVWQNSLSLFGHAARIDDTNYVAHSHLGSVLMKKGRHDEALSHLNRAVSLHPAFWPGYLMLGNYYLHHGQYEEAQNVTAKALELNPASAFAHTNMGYTLMLKDNVRGALNHFLASVLLSPSDKIARNNIGYALLKIGKVDAAVAQFGEAIRLDPNFEAAQLNLGLAFKALEKTDEADAQFRITLGINPQNKQARHHLESKAN